MRRRTLLVALASVPLAAMPVSAEEAPVDIVAAIYKLSAGKDGKYQGESAVFKKPVQKKYFSKALLAEFEANQRRSKASGDVGLDFDPVTSSQDPSVKELKIEPGASGADKAEVTASFRAYDAKQRLAVHYHFIRESGGWRLDNVTGDGGEETWDLRKILRETP